MPTVDFSNGVNLLIGHQPTKADIIQNMEYNLCRCGAYIRIIQAIQSAAEKMKGVEQR